MEFRQLLRNQQLEESTTCNIGQNDNCIVLIDSESLSPIEQLEHFATNHFIAIIMMAFLTSK